MINEKIAEKILQITHSQKIYAVEQVQELWSNYGQILRIKLDGEISSVVVKKIRFPKEIKHPRGWNTDISHERKVKSYEIESKWYQKWSKETHLMCRVPKCLHQFIQEEEKIIILEDLDIAGYPLRKSNLEIHEIEQCLNWLASFHANFMNQKPLGLWNVGTYWNLETRPDEWSKMEDGQLKKTASKLDDILNNGKYQTLVHGDAKVANFCFSEDKQYVAAVDFQYVGGGCGMKDIIYLFSSCMNEHQLQKYDQTLLDYYFQKLREYSSSIVDDIENEWRELYEIAWADFIRFLKGWMPTHYKINTYSERQVEKALSKL